MPRKRLRIGIADDHDFVRRGLVSLLRKSPEFSVVGEAADGHETIDLVERRAPDVVILDISMPGMNGVDVLKSLRSRASTLKILVLSMYTDEPYISECFKAGANGYVVKSADTKEITRAIRTIARGRQYPITRHADAGTTNAGAEEHVDETAAPLTRREREVLQFIARGLTNKQIAGVLSISTNTINSHRANIMHKLEIHETAGLVRYAVEKGIA